MDPWVEFVQSTLARLLKVHVPTRLITQVVAPIVPVTLEPTPANAMHLLRSSLCAKLVGHALAAQANKMILAEISEVPVKLKGPHSISGRTPLWSSSRHHRPCKALQVCEERQPELG